MRLDELQEKDPLTMTKEELEQSCMKLLDEMDEILTVAHARIDKERNATAA